MPLLGHRRSGRLATVEQSPQVDPLHLGPGVVRQVEEGADRVDPCVGDEDVDASERADRLVDHCPRGFGVTDIGGKCNRRGGARPPARLDRLARRIAGEVVDDDGRCLLGEGNGDRSSDTAGGARHDDDPATELGIRRRSHQKWPPQAS